KLISPPYNLSITIHDSTTLLRSRKQITFTSCIIQHAHLGRQKPRRSQSDLTDEIAEGLLRTVIKNGAIIVEDPKDYDAMCEVFRASSLSHNNLTECGRDLSNVYGGVIFINSSWQDFTKFSGKW
ncbi:MAG: hypothetical protein IJV04_04810, partial [Lachnospiraceae bacterium]|nr:hypothetical protein [Lachnospiraceae bacterium]